MSVRQSFQENEEFTKYARSLDLVGELYIRLAEIYTQCLRLTADSIDDMFVSERRDDDGSRRYGDALFFTAEMMFQVANFTTRPTIWVGSHKDRPVTTKLEMQEFDLENVTAKSEFRATAFWSSEGSLRAELIATDSNCVQLMRILKKYFLKPI